MSNASAANHVVREDFQPYRLVLVSTPSGGVQTAHLTVGGVGAPDVTRRMNQGRVITYANALELFEAGWAEPLDRETRTLVDGLNIMRVTTHPADAGPEIPMKQIEGAILALLGDLPHLIASETEYISRGTNSKWLMEYRRSNLSVFEDLLSAARQTRSVLGTLPPKVREAPWHSDAVGLASFLEMVGSRTGKTMNFLQARRREVLFIERALSLAGVVLEMKGETRAIDADTIARSFARRRASLPAIAAT